MVIDMSEWESLKYDERTIKNYNQKLIKWLKSKYDSEKKVFEDNADEGEFNDAIVNSERAKAFQEVINFVKGK